MLFNITVINPDNIPLTYAGSQVFKLDMTFNVDDPFEAEDLMDHFLSELDSSNEDVSAWLELLYKGDNPPKKGWSHHDSIRISWHSGEPNA